MKLNRSVKKRSRLRRLETYVELASEAGEIVLSMRDRPTRLDWVAVAVRAFNVIMRIRKEAREATAKNPWQFFDTDGMGAKWRAVPEDLANVLLEHVEEVEIVEDYWDGDDSGDRVCLGRIDDEVLGWIQVGDENVVGGPYLLRDRERETLAAFGRRVWRRVDSRHCVVCPDGLVPDAIGSMDDIVPTAQFRQTRERLERFLAYDIPRSFLFVGPPGTGKSAGIRYLTSSLGLSSVRVDLRAFATELNNSSVVSARSLRTVVRLLRPDVMILDDIDRVRGDGELLHFLEMTARACRVVLASANCPDNMMGAALRPGRFDELVHVDTLDPDVVRTLLGDDADLAERVQELPAAYLVEFLKRRRALGRDQAIAELGELVSRLEKVGKMTSDGN